MTQAIQPSEAMHMISFEAALNDRLLHGSEQEIKELFVGRFGAASAWASRAEFLFDAVIPALVVLRDSHGIKFSSFNLREAFDLSVCEGLAWDGSWERSGRLDGLDEACGELREYLLMLPGYLKDRDAEYLRSACMGSVREHHAYILMTIHEAISSIARNEPPAAIEAGSPSFNEAEPAQQIQPASTSNTMTSFAQNMTGLIAQRSATTLKTKAKLRGTLPSHRALLVKLPAADGSPFVRIDMANIGVHVLRVNLAAGAEGEEKFHLDFDAMNRDHRSVRVATFNSLEEALEAQAAIERAFSSKKKFWIAGGLAFVLWVILFMPMGGNKAPQQVSMGGQMPSQMQLPRGQLSVPGALPRAAPSAAPSGLPIPSLGDLSGLPTAPVQPAPAAPGAAGAPAAAADADPFGLKIDVNGAGSGPVR